MIPCKFCIHYFIQINHSSVIIINTIANTSTIYDDILVLTGFTNYKRRRTNIEYDHQLLKKQSKTRHIDTWKSERQREEERGD